MGGGSHRLEGVTSHRERVRPVKERVGSSARDGDGEGGSSPGGTNDVHAIPLTRIGPADSIASALQVACSTRPRLG